MIEKEEKRLEQSVASEKVVRNAHKKQQNKLIITNIYAEANCICSLAQHKSNNHKKTLNRRHLGLLCDRIILDDNDNKRH